MQGDVGPLSPGRGSAQAKVPDGLRYHVLDVWAEELAQIALKDEATDEDARGAELMMSAVRTLARDAKGKVVRTRARECVSEWETLKAGGEGREAREGMAVAGSENRVDRNGEDMNADEEDGGEWSGFGD